MFQRSESCALELEAANYFKLDMNQMSQLNKSTTESEEGKESKKAYNSKKHLKNQLISTPSYNSQNQAKFQRDKVLGKKLKREEVFQPKRSNVDSENMSKTKSYLLSQSSKTKLANDLTTKDPVNVVGSSSASTNSLPSISSSPSISPSLVCPHLSLDDILSCKNDTISPHTIGLCAMCRMDPPPNMHSPLSPAFKPSLYKVPKLNFSKSSDALEGKRQSMTFEGDLNDRQVGKKSHSDFSSRKAVKSTRFSQEESLDYFLKPNELRQLQMSSTLRHSVEFIRNNTTEAGRIVKIFKNGAPFERPLRICIMRGEFTTLDHLLDYVNSRQLIPCGARYLFHLDGQLVYSENELKHGSVYIVSGTRNFDYRASKILKDQLKEEAIKSIRLQTPQTSRKFIDKRENMESGQVKEVNESKTLRGKKSDLLVAKQQNKTSRDSKYSVGLSGSRNSLRLGMTESSAKVKLSSPYVKLSITNANENSDTKDDLQQTLITKSSEQLADQPQIDVEKNVRLARAKSELSALPKKTKKNVTFIDTGRGSSPSVITKVDEHQKKETKSSDSLSSLKEREIFKDTSKVNTKVLKEELSTNEIGIQVSDSLDGYLIDLPIPLPKPKQTYLKKGQGFQAGRKLSNSSKKSLSQRNKIRSSDQPKESNYKIISIREKQLSTNELNKFKDLDHGDHHNEAHHNQEFHVELENSGGSENLTSNETETKNSNDFSDSNPMNNDQNCSSVEIKVPVDRLDQSNICWQYPLGHETSTTPTERPVSQSDADENVHARVITPTPSMSTANESGSFAMSYEANTVSGQQDGEESSTKKSIPVMGALRGGLDPPTRNFKLLWINGFSIDDQQQDNNNNNNNHTSLSEAKQQSSVGISTNFRPNERFQNWLFHSKKHNELIYPAGSLVVLWCRWNNEQRYYSQHTSSVCALALASLDSDLAASAQMGDPVVSSNTLVHLWSLSSLETLSVIEDDHFRGLRIFSLRVKNSVSEGCELSVCARDNKRIWLHIFLLSLNDKTNNENDQTALATTKKSEPKRFSQPVYSLQSSKLLQSHQIPLHIIRMSNVRDQSASGCTDIFNDLVISFGRNHLIVWFLDRRKRQIVRLQPTNQSTDFSDLLARANCIERISPQKLLLGDSLGNLNLLTIECFEPADDQKKSPKRKSAPPPQYNLKIIPLVKLKSLTSGEGTAAITCLTRISDGLFVGADSECVLHFWQLDSNTKASNESSPSCQELNTVRLPRDFGFITSIVLSKYSRKEPMVEFYAASTSNSILFGSAQISSQISDQSDRKDSYLSITVIFEGHETPSVNLVADTQISVNDARNERGKSPKLSGSPMDYHSAYFTCSLDCKICKWKGKNLIWKSMLPSACASLAVHPTGFVLAVGSADGTVYILDKVSGLLISYFPLTPVCINCLAYSKDGALLAAGCANGSIFILPVYERGLKYKKVSIFQSPYPVVSLQFSLDNKYILTSVTHASYQELILWDLPNFRYMRENVRIAVDKIEWFDSICSASEDVRAIWENANLKSMTSADSKAKHSRNRLNTSSLTTNPNTVINLSCHRFVQSISESNMSQQTFSENLAIASDIQGHLRLFRYPCYDIQQGFYEIRISSSPINCCRFLSSREKMNNEVMFVSTSVDGYIFLWTLI